MSTRKRCTNDSNNEKATPSVERDEVNKKKFEFLIMNLIQKAVKENQLQGLKDKIVKKYELSLFYKAKDGIVPRDFTLPPEGLNESCSK